jgi:hypothetical protein
MRNGTVFHEDVSVAIDEAIDVAIHDRQSLRATLTVVIV